MIIFEGLFISMKSRLSINQLDLHFPVFHHDVVFACFQKPFSILIYEAEITFQINIKTENLCISGFDKLFLKVFQFFYRAGYRAVRIGDKPKYSLCAVTLSHISDRYFHRQLFTTFYHCGRRSDCTILKFRIAQTMTERIKRLTGYILIES